MRLRTRLYAASAAILVIGLTCSVLVYLTAADEPSGAAGYVLADGTVYAIPAATSKTYVREVQRFGGKAAVLFDEVGTWFASLWQGRRLAYTLAWISAVSSVGLYLFARHALIDPESGP